MTDDNGLICPHCGYDCRTQVERGIAECPECGERLPDLTIAPKWSRETLWRVWSRRTTHMLSERRAWRIWAILLILALGALVSLRFFTCA